MTKGELLGRAHGLLLSELNLGLGHSYPEINIIYVKLHRQNEPLSGDLSGVPELPVPPENNCFVRSSAAGATLSLTPLPTHKHTHTYSWPMHQGSWDKPLAIRVQSSRELRRWMET